MFSLEVKICGLTTLEDALAALECGADYLGFVLYPGSPRAVTPDRVRAIVGRLPPETRAVGVFVNSAPRQTLATAVACGLAAVQLHGQETATGYREFPLPVWRAVSFRAGRPEPDPGAWPAARYVADSSAAGGHTGGTGRVTDWAAAAVMAGRLPTMLAGGLKPDNVAAAVAQVRPVGVDTAGGVEIRGRPGRKDAGLIRRFIEAARSAQ